MKDIIRVLDAVNLGCETSDAISAVTGLTIASTSAHLSELFDLGLVRRTSEDSVRFKAKGRAHHTYAPEPEVRATKTAAQILAEHGLK